MPADVMACPLQINASPFCIFWKEKVVILLHDFAQSACSHFMSAGQGVAASHVCAL